MQPSGASAKQRPASGRVRVEWNVAPNARTAATTPARHPAALAHESRMGIHMTAGRRKFPFLPATRIADARAETDARRHCEARMPGLPDSLLRSLPANRLGTIAR